MFMGFLFLLFGILLLLDRWHVIHFELGEYILPVALIALGISWLFNSKRNRDIHVD
ncbi:MAG: hypothetical protein KAU36_00870 [candidate division Zixibacteria bacterium]|nr:hypothetical protein [candidate division Zixibacteria bacterium]